MKFIIDNKKKWIKEEKNRLEKLMKVYVNKGTYVVRANGFLSAVKNNKGHKLSFQEKLRVFELAERVIWLEKFEEQLKFECSLKQGCAKDSK